MSGLRGGLQKIASQTNEPKTREDAVELMRIANELSDFLQRRGKDD